MAPTRFLILGCGSIGKRHLTNLQALGIRELLVFEQEPSRRAEITARFGVACAESLEQAWAWGPQVVFVTVPTHLHLPLALAAAERGCHLFVEKPLAHTLEGTEELVKVAARQKLISLVGCNLRFHPGLRRVKQLLEERVVGQVCSARVEVGQYLPDWHPQEDYRKNYSARRSMGGGIILDAIHELDYIRWLLGEVESVHAFCGKLSRLEIETEDTAAILLRFVAGPIAEVHLDYVQRAPRRTCQIIGDEGTILWEYGAGKVTWFTAGSRQWQTWENPAGWETNQMYVDELRHFLACLEGRESSTLDLAEGRRVLRIALAAKESSPTGRTMHLEARP